MDYLIGYFLEKMIHLSLILMVSIPQIYLITDNTGSMGMACSAASTSASEVCTTMDLLLGRSNVTIGVVGDYDGATPDNECGGVSFLSPETTTPDDRKKWFTRYMRPCGGGGTEEAYRTVFNLLLKRNEGKGPAIAFLFCDAGPHGVASNYIDREGMLEQKYIKTNKLIWNWEELGETLKVSDIRVITFLTTNNQQLITIYNKIGDVVVVKNNTSSVITNTMLTVLYSLFGQDTSGLPEITYSGKSSDLHGKSSDLHGKSSAIESVHKVDMLSSMRQNDPERVMRLFDQLLNVESVMCLTSSPILGKYWRNLICGSYRFINNGVYSDQVQSLLNKLSKCMESLVEPHKSVLKKWIEESHNDTPLCRELVSKGTDGCQALVLPEIYRKTISLDDVLQLGRGGDFHVLADLIAKVQISDDKWVLPEDENQAPEYIPYEGLREADVFRLLGNLIKPSFLFSYAVAHCAAILSLNNKYLSDMATSFLVSDKSKWIKMELDADGSPKFPLFWSLNFMRLLKLVPDSSGILTEDEIKFRDKYLLTASILRNHDATMQITVPIILSDLRLDVTWKRLCSGCKQNRCFSVFPGDSDVCGLCIVLSPTHPNYVRVIDNHQQYGTYMDKPEEIKDSDEQKTHWAQCGTCRGNYGVIDYQHLKVRPKCHNCRFALEPELVECSSCLHKYLNPGGSAIRAISEEATREAHDESRTTKIIRNVRENGKFICPRCYVHPKDMIGVVEVKLSDLIVENPSLTSLVPIKPYTLMTNSNIKLWKRVLDLEYEVVEFTPSNLTYRGYKIHNSQSVINTFKETLLTHYGRETCMMCIEDRPLREMSLACGDAGCLTRICKSCVSSWYSQVNRGCVVAEGHVKCPFCKKIPKHKIVHGLGLFINHIRNLRSTKGNNGVVCVWDPHTVYAVCIECLMLKPALARECAGVAIEQEIRNYSCDECVAGAGKGAYIGTKKCPSCTIDVEKNGGCNHITCICGAHWCWSCGKEFSSNTIYDHMAGCSGIFGNDAENGYDGYDSDY